MFQRLINRLRRVCEVCLCHRALHGALAAAHLPGVAYYPEIYLPTVAIYAVLAVRG